MNDRHTVKFPAEPKVSAAHGRKSGRREKPPVYLRRGESGIIAAAHVAIMEGERQRALRRIRQLVAATGSKDLSVRLRQLIDEFIQAENRALVHGEGTDSQAKVA